MTETTETEAPKASLTDLRMPELQALASRLGISGISKMRKNDLVQAIRERRRANEQRSKTAGNSDPVQQGAADTSGRDRRRSANQASSDCEPQAAAGKEQAAQGGSASADSGDAKATLDEIQFPEPAERAKDEPNRGGRRAGRSSSPAQGKAAAASSAKPGAEPAADDDGEEERSGRRRRGRDRYRDRKRRQNNREGGGADEPEIMEDDILIPVAGVLDVLENYAFVRTSGYLPGASDVYVSLGQVKKSGLRRGDAIAGAVRQPREGETQRQKFNALVRLDTVNGSPVADTGDRPEFDALTAMYPDEPMKLETSSRQLITRAIDIVAPIGKGQRTLLLAPPRSGRTQTLLQIADAITANHADAHLMAVLVDQRPEEVTQWQRQVAGEVVASTFDRPASDHTSVAELAIERAKRLVELGQHVVVLLDSLTSLARAYNAAATGTARSGPVDPAALHPAKAFFGAARSIENGGSLTIVASARVEFGSEIDELILEEFFGTENSEVRLVRDGANRTSPALVNPQASGTRHEDLLLTADELAVVGKVRRVLEGMPAEAATELLVTRLSRTTSNADFLLAASRAASGELS
ncbi:MAG: transcription termination factor Rho [Beutenbergiaceae bacterium]